jgi:HEAT repeat protein
MHKPHHCPSLAFGLVAMLLLPGPQAVAEGPASKPPEAPSEDAFGRPLRWSEPVGGARISLHQLRTRLFHGEPVSVIVQSLNPRDGPYLYLTWTGAERTAKLELTTAGGEAVPFTVELTRQGAGLEGAYHVARLWPQGKFARGRYFAPGAYRVRLVVDCKPDRSHGRSWSGRIASRVVAFEVLGEGEGRMALVPPALRERAAAWVRDLGAADFRKREAAVKAVEPVTLEVLPPLEDALASKDPEQAARARRLVLARLQPVLAQPHGPYGYLTWEDVGPVLASFGEPTWQLLRQQLKGQLPPALKIQAALFAPVGPHKDLARPTGEQVARVVARLGDPDPLVRLRAVRALTRTGDERILKALAERLADPFSYTSPSECRGYTFFPVVHEARAALIWQGKAAVGPLIGWGRAHPAQGGEVARLLGRIGPDPQALTYLAELVNGPVHDGRAFGVQALAKFGPAGGAALFKKARDVAEVHTIRRDAITALGYCGDAKAHGPFLVGMLGDASNEFVWAAATALGKLKDREALPALLRVARDEKVDQNARYAAMHAVVGMVERKEAEALLLELLEPRRHGGVRGVAMGLLAEFDCKKAIPLILDALADADWYVRARADGALRGFAGRPDGVGYDAQRPDPAPWRAYWKQQR